jgi:adenylosuccinate synthase
MKTKPDGAEFAFPTRSSPEAFEIESNAISKKPTASSCFTGASRFVRTRFSNEISPLVERMRPFVAETSHFFGSKKQNKKILLEGAQATLFDVDHGTYPYVTSSNPTAGGAAVGAGIPPHHITGVLGIVRTYATRVGEGPFPTEMLDEEEDMANLIRQRGNEYGSVTKRPRRCGWFDAVATRYAAELNGFNSLALTKLDVLDALEEIKVCVGYEIDGKRIDTFPAVSLRSCENQTGLRNA